MRENWEYDHGVSNLTVFVEDDRVYLKESGGGKIVLYVEDEDKPYCLEDQDESEEFAQNVADAFNDAEWLRVYRRHIQSENKELLAKVQTLHDALEALRHVP